MISLEQIEEQIAGIQQQKIKIVEEAKLLILQLDAAEQALQILAIPARQQRAQELAQLAQDIDHASTLVQSQPQAVA